MIYCVKFPGIHMQGYGVVVAATRKQARELVEKKLIQGRFFHSSIPIRDQYKMELVDTSEEKFTIIWDGDY